MLREQSELADEVVAILDAGMMKLHNNALRNQISKLHHHFANDKFKDHNTGKLLTEESESYL